MLLGITNYLLACMYVSRMGRTRREREYMVDKTHGKTPFGSIGPSCEVDM
jgi:hypothetical protein